MTAPLREPLGDYLALRRALGYRLARPEKLLSQFLDHLEQTGAVNGHGRRRRWPGRWLPARRRLELVGLPALGGARLRHLPAHPRPGARGPGPGSAAAAAAAGQPVLVFRRRHRRADRRDRVAAHPAAARDLRDADRAAGRHRHAGRGGDRARPRRPRPRRRAAGGAARQVRQEPASSRCTRPPSPRCAATCGCGTGCTQRPASPALLVSTAGTRLLYCNVHGPSTGWSSAPGSRRGPASCRPRIHDLRHSFAVTRDARRLRRRPGRADRG